MDLSILDEGDMLCLLMILKSSCKELNQYRLSTGAKIVSFRTANKNVASADRIVATVFQYCQINTWTRGGA